VSIEVILANQSIEPFNLVNSPPVKSKMRLRTRSTLRRVQPKMRLRTRSNLRRVKSGLSPQIRRYQPSAWSTLRQVKSKMRLCTRSTLRRSSRRCVFAHGQLSAVSSWVYPCKSEVSSLQLGQLSTRSSRRCRCIFAHGQPSAVSSPGLPSHPINSLSGPLGSRPQCLVQSQPLHPIM